MADSDETVGDTAAINGHPNLKPFKKGQSGNPSGRPKKVKEIAAVADKHGVAAIEKLAKLIDSPDDRVALAAAQAVLDRAVGKPKQSVDLKAKHTNAPGSEPLSDTARWIVETLRARSDREAQKPVSH